jgi:choline monooxygenase
MQSMKLSDLLTDEERAEIRAPIEKAKTFPRRAFIDDDFYQFEREHVLRQSWIAVSFDARVKDEGDLLPLNILGVPILLVRGKDKVIRAFHNICPYDGCEVSIHPQKGIDSITTPYHGWQYDLEGKLRSANYWDGTPDANSINPEDLHADLIPLPCTVWLHTIFVHPGKNPLPFEQQFEPVLNHFIDLDLDQLEIGLDKSDEPIIHSLEIKSNWKTVYENYSPNVYHESFVHEMYRKSPHSPRVDSSGVKTYTEINDPSGFLGLCYDNKIGDSFYGQSRLPKIRNKDGSDNSVNTIANVFPNWVITLLGDAARVAIFLPEGPESGIQLLATLFYGEGAANPGLVKDRNESARKGIMARKEDNLICESIQRARHSPAVSSQFYSPFWDAMHYTLSNLVLDKLEQSEQ